MNEILNQLIHEFDRPLRNPVLIFSLILFIILIAPILIKRIRIPGIIGLILSGVIVGPHGLNLLAKTDAIQLFATIGLLYIMFIAGLELDLADFKKNRHKSGLFGFFTFAIPILIGFPICYNLLGYDFNASFLTASMFATHTLVAYPIVSRLGISKDEAVAVAVGGTILTDTAVLLILAVIKGNAKPEGLSFDFWVRLIIGLTFFSLIMFLIVPKITKWFFRKLESEKHSHYIFVLSIVFFSAFLAEIAGVEPIIGAFAAGLVLNPLIPHSSALMNRIEYVGNALFIPFFLINVGMLVDLSILFKGYTALLVAFSLTVGAIISKYFAAWITQVLFKYTIDQRNIIAGLSSSHAAATIAIILIGYNLKILDENILNGTIILILFTCLFATFLTEKAAKKMAMAVRTDSGDNLPIVLLPEKIILPVANFSNFEKLLDFAILVKNQKSKNPITMLSVVTNDADSEKNVANARKMIDSVLLHASASETKVDFITTIDFNPGSGISRVSKEVLASIIMLGWPRSKGFIDKLLDDVLALVLENSDKMVIITNAERVSMSYKMIQLFCPPLAELEPNFVNWLKKVNKLANEFSIPIDFYGTEKTSEAVSATWKQKNYSSKINYITMASFDKLEEIAQNASHENMVILISARPGAVSDTKELDTLPQRVEQLFELNHRVIIIP
jgi:Kef-type K+ transport system membrane component KefB